jgi:hypothetical protein
MEVRILPHEVEDKMTVEVVYTRNEWHHLETLYKKLKCKEEDRDVRMYDGCEVDFDNIAWQLRHVIQFRSRNYTIDVYNDPGLHNFITHDSINIAMFRVIPDCDSRTCTARMTFNSILVYSKILDILPRVFNNYIDLLDLLTVKSVRIIVEVVT